MAPTTQDSKKWSKATTWAEHHFEQGLSNTDSKCEPKYDLKFGSKYDSKYKPKYKPKYEPKYKPKYDPKYNSRLEELVQGYHMGMFKVQKHSI